MDRTEKRKNPRVDMFSIRTFWKEAVQWNLFPKMPPSIDHHELQHQRIITRIFIIITVLCLCLLLIYTAAIDLATIIRTPNPTYEKYQQLQGQDLRSFLCPCKQVSIRYETFLEINYRLHQICSNFFISDHWISMIASGLDLEIVNSNDFRVSSVSSFSSLKAFCNLVERYISTNLEQFYSNRFISASVLSKQLLQAQSATFVEQFISSTTSSFFQAINLVRDAAHANILLSGYQFNYKLFNNTRTRYYLGISMNYEDGCTCMTNTSCSTDAAIYKDGSSLSS